MAKRWLTRNVLVLGAVSLLTDASSEMIVPLLPLFLSTLAGGGALALGLIEGAAEATSSVLKLVSGIWSDRARRQRPLIIAGYGLSSLVRPLVALATAAPHVLAVRVADRVGKGLRTSPRDALLAASAPPEERGAAFGFHRAMDHVGAVVGPLLAVGVLALWPGDLRRVFWLAAVPAVLALATLALGLREAPVAPAPASRVDLRVTPDERRVLARFLVPLGLFTLGNASETFLLLKAGAVQAPVATLPLLWMALHVVKSATSALGGRLADRIGARRTVASGWVVYAGVYVALALTDRPAVVAMLFVVYGLYHGLTEAPSKVLIAAAVAETRRGTAFGWYNLTVGMLALPAGLLFGWLWQTYGSSVAFSASALLAVVALAALLATARSDRRS